MHLEFGCRLSPLSMGKIHPGYLREMQLTKIRKRLDQLKKAGRIDAVVMAGDFNDVGEYCIEGTGGLVDKFTAETGFVNHGTVHGFEKLDTCANKMKMSLRIDHILSSPEIGSTDFYVPDEHDTSWFGWPFRGGISLNWNRDWFWGNTGSVNIYNIIDKYGSDHLPMIANLYVK